MARKATRPPRGRFGRHAQRGRAGVEDVAATTDPTATPDDAGPVGLDDAEAAEFLAACAAAERASMPDRLPLALALALAFLIALVASGVPQRVWNESRDRNIERLVQRQDLKRGWSARVGATREDLGLAPRPAHIKPVRPLWQIW